MAGVAAQGSGPQRAEAGFTLVEIMIVVFIIALMSTVVVMNLPSAQSGTATRADALQRDLNRAAREAIVSGEPVALAVRGGQYRFERYRAGYWSPAGGVAGPQAAAASGLVLDIVAAGEPRRKRVREATPRTRTGASAALPDFERKLVFSPVGDATPVTILLTDGADRAGITVSANGEITRMTPAEAGSS